MTEQAMQLIKSVSLFAENLFAQFGALCPFWYCVPAVGRPFSVLSEVSDRDTEVDRVRSIFEEKGVVAYVFIGEAWMSSESPFKPSEGLDRREVVLLSAEAEAEECVAAQREIVRPARGKPYLGPLEFLKVAGGARVGMLPHKGTVH